MKFLFGLLLALGALAAHAQENIPVPALPGMTATRLAGMRAANEPRKLTFYKVDAHTLSETPVENSPKVEFIFRDSVSGTVRQYYASGKLRHLVSYAHIPRHLKHGIETTWGQNGQLLTRQEFRAGEAEGEFLAYFLDGKVERKITYHHDHIVSIECFNRKGQPKNCVNQEVQPEYPGSMGMEGLAVNLRKLLTYPPTDLQDNRTGSLALHFTIDTTGAIISPQVLDGPSQREYFTGISNLSASLGLGKLPIPNSPSPEMYAAVMSSLRTVKGFRKPGIQEGRAVAVTMSLEVHFEMKKPGKGTIRVKMHEHARFPPYNQQH